MFLMANLPATETPEKRGGRKRKRTLNFRQLVPKASHIQGTINYFLNLKKKNPCHVTPNFTISKASENSALDYPSMSFLLASFLLICIYF